MPFCLRIGIGMLYERKGQKRGFRPRGEGGELIFENRRSTVSTSEAWAASVTDPVEASVIGQLSPLLVCEKIAAELLGVSKRQVFELNKAGNLPCVMIGARKLYSVTRLREFADGGTK